MSNYNRYFRVLAIITAAASLGGCVYGYRYLAWNNSDIRDYRKFPERKISNAPPIYRFKDETSSGEFKKKIPVAEYQSNGKIKRKDWEEFLAQSDTTVFIVIKDDAIIYEGYFNGYSRDSINVSFSVAKSYTSVLTGIAIDEGLIGGVNDPVTKYLPELKGTGFDRVTLRYMLMMNAGVKWSDMPFPWSDDPREYYTPNLRKLLLNLDKFESVPGEFYHYDSYYPLMMGMILERVTGMTFSEWTEKKLWSRLGMEYPASWSLDSVSSGLEKSSSSLNARAIDFAKLGRLMLRRGDWDGARIVSDKWVIESTSRDRSVEGPGYYKKQAIFAKKPYLYYKYYWWGLSGDGEDYDFTGIGHLGQYIYVSPSKNVIIVRNGKTTGGVDFWPDVFRAIARKL